MTRATGSKATSILSAKAKRAAARFSFRRKLVWALMGFLLLTFPGCGGCGGDGNKNAANKTPEELKQEEEERRKKEEEQKRKDALPDFSLSELRTIPSSKALVGAFVKPGHWSVATVDVLANKYDLPDGELTTDPLKLDGMPFRMGSSRDALLSKEQEKSLPIVLYIPPGRSSAPIDVRLSRQSGGVIAQKATGVSLMPAHQFHMVVLAAKPDQYTFLPTLYSIRPWDWETDNLGTAKAPYFRVHIPNLASESLPLPDTSLCWTSTAFVFWDGLTPETLNTQQQTAMIDWLHWGGQLVISGPGTLDLLKNSFLQDHLPAEPGRDLSLDNDDVQEFGEQWMANKLGRSDRKLLLADAISVKELLVDADNPDVRVLATTRTANGEIPMAVERTIGRGRVVVTAFSLAERQFVPPAWSGYDSFFNACLLRRPPRNYTLGGFLNDQLTADWSVTPRPAKLDPRLESHVNYFSRDARTVAGSIKIDGKEIESFDGIMLDRPEAAINRNLFGANSDNEAQASGGGVASWSDFNIAASTARETLRKAAGIVVPDASFVLKMLAIYVVVLVPVNWLIFRLIGRVEWAWIAAPVITIGFALVVINQAELDIGFARARTEVSLVEFQAGYPRAHVTRYTALYTSLSTEYDTRFTDPTALVQPFSRLGAHEERRDLLGATPTTINYRRTPARVTLSGFEVSSNSTEMLHSEHMLDVGGGIYLKGFDGVAGTVVNDSDLALRGAAILTEDRAAWIGELAAHAEAEFALQGPDQLMVIADREAAARREAAGNADATGPDAQSASNPHEFWFSQRDQEPPTSHGGSAREIDLRPLVQLAEARGRNSLLDTFPVGELRLVAWNVDPLPGMDVEPAAPQVRYGNVIIAHLRLPKPGTPLPNANTPANVNYQEELADDVEGID